MDFDSEDDDGADGSDYVCDYNGPVAEHDALDDEEDGSESEHAECGECDAVGVALRIVAMAWGRYPRTMQRAAA